MYRKAFFILLLSSVITLASCKPMDIIADKDTKQQGSYSFSNSNKDDVLDNGPVRRGSLKLFCTYPDTLNPVLSQNLYYGDISNLMFESIVGLDKNQKPVPELSDKWDVSPDGLTWTFHIRDNVKWHDGMPFSAEDVEFTVSTILNPSVKSLYKNNLDNVSTFSTVDKSNFSIVLKKPDSFTPEHMTFPVIAKHCFVDEDIITSPRNMKPVGTGPYKFEEYSEKKDLKLVMNESWWNSKANGEKETELPYLHDVDVKLYGNYKDAPTAFSNDEIDVMPAGSDDFIKYSGRNDISLRKYTSNKFDFLAFNLSKYVFEDKVVRQAIAGAIDKQALINECLPGSGIPSDIPVIPDTWLYDTNVLNYTPAPDKSKQILEGETNKIGRSGDSLLSLEILVNKDNDTRSRVAEKLAAQLGAAGITAKVEKVDWDTQMQRIRQKRFDIALLGCTIPTTPDISFLYSSSEIGSGRNIAGYSNSQVDLCIDKLLTENDPVMRKAQFINMKSIIVDEVPYIGLYFYSNAIVCNKKIRGDVNPYLWNIYNVPKWYVPVG